jgi:pyruvate-ferredoxin/flavodoxin oxidoreductase
VIVRLFRPSTRRFSPRPCPPPTDVDRRARPHQGAGAAGEPLYLDVVAALADTRGGRRAGDPRVIGGRYGLSSKEFTPRWSSRLRRAGAAEPQAHFTVGIVDDVTHLSLAVRPDFRGTSPTTRCRPCSTAWAADGTVGANKNSVKIIGEHTDLHAQGYFVYDSKKSGSTDGVAPALLPGRSLHLPVDEADFVACHQFGSSARSTCSRARRARRSCSTAPTAPTRCGITCRIEVQQQIVDKQLGCGWSTRWPSPGGRAWAAGSTRLQTCFFKLTGVLPTDEAIAAIKASIEKTYGKRGETVVAATSPPSTGRWRLQRCRRCLGDAGHDPGSCRRPSVPDGRPRLRAAGHRHDDGRRRATCCRCRRCPSTARSRPAPPSGRSGRSPTRSRSGIPTSASTAPAAPGLPPRRHPDQGLTTPTSGAPRRVPVEGGHRERTPEGMPHHPGGARRLHRLRGVRGRLPGKSKEEVKHKAINMEPKAEHLERERRQLRLLPLLPDRPRPPRSRSVGQGLPAARNRCSSSPGACAGCAARRRT